MEQNEDPLGVDEKQGHGDCFVVAAELVLSDPSLVLVHGRPLGSPDTTLEGVRYWHAWVEDRRELRFEQLPHPVVIETVIDRSNNKDLGVPKAMYYKLGRIEQTWRYSSDDARRLMLETGHYGPWVSSEMEAHTQIPGGCDGTE